MPANVIRLPLSRVRTDRFNNVRVSDRDDIKHLQSLQKEHGQNTYPAVARADDGDYDLVFGFGRFEALQNSKVEESNFFDVSGTKLRAVQLAENIGRKDLHWAEIAYGVSEVRAESPDETQTALAKSVGLSQSQFSKYEALAGCAYFDACLERLRNGQPIPAKDEMLRFLSMVEDPKYFDKAPPVKDFEAWCDSDDLSLSFWDPESEDESDDDEADSDDSEEGGKRKGAGGGRLSTKLLDALYKLSKKAVAESPTAYNQGVHDAMKWATKRIARPPQIDGVDSLDEAKGKPGRKAKAKDEAPASKAKGKATANGAKATAN